MKEYVNPDLTVVKFEANETITTISVPITSDGIEDGGDAASE